MNNPYWTLPLWIPRWLRNILYVWECWDDGDFFRNCSRIAKQRFGDSRSTYYWLVSDEVKVTACRTGRSKQWLAWQWAHEDVQNSSGGDDD